MVQINYLAGHRVCRRGLKEVRLVETVPGNHWVDCICSGLFLQHRVAAEYPEVEHGWTGDLGFGSLA